MLRGSVGLLALLRDHPQLQRMLATLFGVSERLSRLLLTHPGMWEPFVDSLGEPVRPMAVVAQSIMAVLMAIYVGMCVRSFIEARRRRVGA
jgi:glutamine synthetase adenylyltransferase